MILVVDLEVDHHSDDDSLFDDEVEDEVEEVGKCFIVINDKNPKLNWIYL